MTECKRSSSPTKAVLSNLENCESRAGRPGCYSAWSSPRAVGRASRPDALIGRAQDMIIWAGRPSACSTRAVGLSLDRPFFRATSRWRRCPNGCPKTRGQVLDKSVLVRRESRTTRLFATRRSWGVVQIERRSPATLHWVAELSADTSSRDQGNHPVGPSCRRCTNRRKNHRSRKYDDHRHPEVLLN